MQQTPSESKAAAPRYGLDPGPNKVDSPYRRLYSDNNAHEAGVPGTRKYFVASRKSKLEKPAAPAAQYDAMDITDGLSSQQS